MTPAPTRDPVVERVIAEFRRVAQAARAVQDAQDALVPFDWLTDWGGDTSAPDPTWEAWLDLDSARRATTLADLLASARPAVRDATFLALKGAA
jgi:hypothetical protein